MTLDLQSAALPPGTQRTGGLLCNAGQYYSNEQTFAPPEDCSKRFVCSVFLPRHKPRGCCPHCLLLPGRASEVTAGPLRCQKEWKLGCAVSGTNRSFPVRTRKTRLQTPFVEFPPAWTAPFLDRPRGSSRVSAQRQLGTPYQPKLILTLLPPQALPSKNVLPWTEPHLSRSLLNTSLLCISRGKDSIWHVPTDSGRVELAAVVPPAQTSNPPPRPRPR